MSKKEKYSVDYTKWAFPDSPLFSEIQPEYDFERIIKWYENFKVNRDTIGFQHSVSDLPSIKGPALIVDKSMASTQYFEQLRSIRDFKGTIFCCDRALYTLIEHKLPDYVCNVDLSPLCLHPNSLIYTDIGWKQISQVQIGDMVLSHDGAFHKVTKTLSRPYQGSIVAIAPTYFLERLMLTPEHPILALKRQFKRGDYSLSKMSLQWIPADALSHLDFVAFAVDRSVNSNSWLTPEWARLVGYYLAEGSINHNSRTIQLYFGIHESHIISDVANILETLGFTARIYEHEAVTILFQANAFYPFFASMGNKSTDKVLLPEMLHLPSAVEKQLIKGLWLGDGQHWESYGFVYGSSSSKLIWALRMLLLRQGIIGRVFCRWGKPSCIDGREIKQRSPFYVIQVQGPDTDILADIMDMPRRPSNMRRAKHAYWKNGLLITAIKNIEKIQYSGLVYNLEVEETNSYNTTHFCVHNCLSFFDRPDVKKVMDKITAIFVTTTNPLTVRLWHGKRVFFTGWLGGPALTKYLMMASLTPMVPTGGQVASLAWILAYNLCANPIGVFGITHSYDDPKETEYPSERLKRRKGPYGTVWQDNTYEFYNNTFLGYISKAAKEGVVTVNTSKAGLLYSPDVKDLSLEEFVKLE